MIGIDTLTPEQVAKMWLAGFVRRWHSNPFMAHVDDRLLGHSGRVALLMLGLWPDTPREALISAIVHDLPEVVIGDVSGLAKRNHPALKVALDVVEAEAAIEMGCEPSTDPVWGERLHLCDKIDAYLYAQHKRPDRMDKDDWPEAATAILRMAENHNLRGKVLDIIAHCAG